MATLQQSRLRFKLASEPWEFDAIHRLNYLTFVEEIPQHPANESRVLTDRFHNRNTYVIAVRGRRLLGMIAFRGERPFSLDGKIPDLDRYLPPGRRVCEVRLLATTAEHRNGVIFRGLADRFLEHATARGYDCAVISGTLRQIRLYQHLGFTPFGPTVGSGDALYQPMLATLESLKDRGKSYRALRRTSDRPTTEPMNFLPGPVRTTKPVLKAFGSPAISHRCERFLTEFEQVRGRLRSLVNAAHVQIMMGTGTLANDAVAAQIASLKSPGLVLSNGAFGDRLIDHAKRFRLPFRVFKTEWGKAFDAKLLQSAIRDEPTIWIWAVHGETSTGVLNDLDMLKSAAQNVGARLCIDAVSSVGVAPVDLSGVALASSVSGKGLASFPGLAFVFHDSPLSPLRNCPRVLDLGHYAENNGVPFTISSNLVAALHASLKRLDPERRYARVERLAAQLRFGLAEIGLRPVADPASFAAVTTIELPPEHRSIDVGRRLEDLGCLVHFRSAYLPLRNWIQFCLMGRTTPLMIDRAIGCLRQVLGR